MIKNIGVIFGGCSCEHEISILSAMQVMHALKEKYHVIPIFINKEGEFYSSARLKEIETYQQKDFILKNNERVTIKKEGQEVYAIKSFFKKEVIDFVIPVLHGLKGEDGSIQGFLEILNVPYAGSDVLVSAIAQSKSMCKKILKSYGFPILSSTTINTIEEHSPFLPCILKPDRLGSSIGIQIVLKEEDWQKSIAQALMYDESVLVEPYISTFLEFNCSVRRVGKDICCSHIEQLIKQEGILSYDDKYQKGNEKGSGNRIVDPVLSNALKEEILLLSKEIYEKLGFKGVIRIDYMVIDEHVVVNEINTIPGSYAFYLWKDSNMLELLEECIRQGLWQYQKQIGRINSFESEVLFKFKHGKKL